MEGHSYVANEFGISLLYGDKTILIAYDYGFLQWRMIIVHFNPSKPTVTINNISNRNPFKG